MENLLVVLEQLISNLGSDIIDKNHTLKKILLQNQSEYIKPDLINSAQESLVELINTCNLQLLECCRQVDILVHLIASLESTKALPDDDRDRLMKCKTLIEDFKRLSGIYKELIQKIADLRPAI